MTPDKLGRMSKNSELFEHVETNLIRYRKTGMYYVKAKIHGKKLKESLETDKLPDARKRLAAWLNSVRGGTSKGKSAFTLQSLIEEYEKWIKNRKQAKRTTQTRLQNVKVIEATWPNYTTARIGNITRHDVENWNHSICTKHEYSVAQANQCLCTLRQMFQLAEDRGLLLNPNPAEKVKQHALPDKKIILPTVEQFNALRELIYSRSPDGGELFDFLALCGTRIESSQNVKWGDIDWKRNVMTFNKAKRHSYSTPLTASFKEFLLKIKPKDAKDTDRITKVDSIKKVMGSCCKKLGLPHLTHHSLRHWFITRVLETNKVGPETLARWVGHRDGGVLLMRVYGHLRDEHSQEKAALI